MKKKIKILFFGLGSIGQRHLSNTVKLLKNNVEISAFRKIKKKFIIPKKGKKLSGDIEKKFNIKLFDNINQIKNKDVDIIFITNPSSLHLKTVLKLKKLKNKYIFIEKPLDSSLNLINKLNVLINKNNLRIFVGYNLRFHSCVIKLLEILNKNKMGRIYQSTFYYGDDLRKWHIYEDYTKSYAAKKNLGGGIVLSSIHEFDLMINIFKKTKFINSHNAKVSNLKMDVEDFSISNFENEIFGQKILSTVNLNCFQRNKERYIKILFENGEIYADLIEYEVRVKKNEKIKKFKFKKENNLMYLNELKFFLNLVIKNKKIPNKFNHLNAIKSLQLALKVRS